MKVCQLCAVDFTVKHFLLPLIDAMRAQNWDVVTVCSDGPHIASLRKQGYLIKNISISRNMNPWSALCSLVKLIIFFREQRFDVLHVHTPIAAVIGRVAGWLTGIPLIIYTAHGFYFHDEMQPWKRNLFISLERVIGKLTHLLFCQSHEDAEEAVRNKIVSSSRVLVIGNGVNPRHFDPIKIGYDGSLRTSLGIPEDAFLVGCICRQVKEKGMVEFIQAAEALFRARSNVWFLVVGERLKSDHSSSVEVEIENAKKNMGPNLVILGARDDVPECLSAIDLFCLPSWREGMPRTIIEAMMMGKPVLATNIRGSREEVVQNITGLLVPTKAWNNLFEAMLKFYDNKSWGRKLGAAGRVRALALYDEDRVVKLQIDRINQEIFT